MQRLTTLCTAVVPPLLVVAAMPLRASTTTQGERSPRKAVSALAGPLGIRGWWDLAFRDEFNSDGGLDTSVWQPGWFGSGISGPVNRMETQGYDSRNVTQSGGYLRLALTSQYGALVSTNPHDGRVWGGYAFRGPAVMEARIFTPGGTTVDNWPAFWSDGQHSPAEERSTPWRAWTERSATTSTTAPGRPATARASAPGGTPTPPTGIRASEA